MVMIQLETKVLPATKKGVIVTCDIFIFFFGLNFTLQICHSEYKHVVDLIFYHVEQHLASSLHIFPLVIL